MKITRPFSGAEIVVVQNLSTLEETKILLSYSTSFFKKINQTVGLRYRASPPGLPLPHGYDNSETNSSPQGGGLETFDHIYLKNQAEEIIKKIEWRAKKIMEQEFPWIEKPKFNGFEDFILRVPGDYMVPHYDGIPGPGKKPQPPNLGAIYYISDDLVGGETYYPEFNISYKPVSGSFIIHPGRPEYLHGVSKIESGWRITMNLFATSEVASGV